MKDPLMLYLLLERSSCTQPLHPQILVITLCPYSWALFVRSAVAQSPREPHRLLTDITTWFENPSCPVLVCRRSGIPGVVIVSGDGKPTSGFLFNGKQFSIDPIAVKVT